MSNEVEIIGVSFKPLSGEFVAVVVEYNEEGKETGRLEASAKSLKRLVEMIEPANPVNL